MTAVLLATRRTLSPVLPRLNGRWVLVAVPLLALLDPQAGEVAVAAVSEAYLQVSVFVAATLALFYALERGLNLDAALWMTRNPTWQVPVAAVLGALPGCGGAIVVITQYVRGQMGFGSVVAVLTATMGDAAFLLLAREPGTGLLVMATGVVVGLVSGALVERLHGRDFMRQYSPVRPAAYEREENGRPPLARIWQWLLVPGVLLGVLGAFQLELDALVQGEPVLWLGFAGGMLSLVVFALGGGRADGSGQGRLGDRVMVETCFVTAWVVVAFLAFELGVLLTGLDLAALFKVWAPAMPLVGVMMGLLPGCGPQIVVTTLYLNGLVPLSAQLGNAISNDGDALFPAIAMAPRAALVATLYSALPALLVAYGFYVLVEV
ncbi:MAG: putative manganese transporter [Candidatus Competibacteraceae bacterium]|nr:putative manganese transporter [Candidatus Competibacteraceae bacterium]